VIDTTSNTVVATVGVGGSTLEVAITPDGTRVYVTNGNDNTVSVVDAASNTVVATVRVGALPFGVAITPDGTRAYVTNSGVASVSGLGSVSVIDTASNIVVATVGVGAFAQGVAITPGIGPPTNKDQCKKGDWKTFTVPRKFKNQGDCLSFVNTRK